MLIQLPPEEVGAGSAAKFMHIIAVIGFKGRPLTKLAAKKMR